MRTKLINVVDYDICNYKKPSMFIIFPFCTFKCGKENCQNYKLAREHIIEMENEELVSMYTSNPLTKAIVFGGLEPFDSFSEVFELIKAFRQVTNDEICIYSGYEYTEIAHQVEMIRELGNIIVKYGRYIPNDIHHFDEVLGIELASSNQYAVKYE